MLRSSPMMRFGRADALVTIIQPETLSMEAYAVQVEGKCRHGGAVDYAAVRRVPFGNQVQWQIRVYYDCASGCHISEVREHRPDRISTKDGAQVPIRS